MDDDQKELLKVGAETAMKPFADLITKLFGGPVEQVGGMWTDNLMVRREIRKIKLCQKLKAAIDEAAFEPRTIPDKIWIPALQEALLEDDDTMHERWANLLANASDPRHDESLLPSFPEILKQLSNREAVLLQAFCDATLSHWHSAGRRAQFVISTESILREWYGVPIEGVDSSVFAAMIDDLLRLGLLRMTTNTTYTWPAMQESPLRDYPDLANGYHVTEYGMKFMDACRPPVKS